MTWHVIRCHTYCHTRINAAKDVIVLGSECPHKNSIILYYVILYKKNILSFVVLTRVFRSSNECKKKKTTENLLHARWTGFSMFTTIQYYIFWTSGSKTVLVHACPKIKKNVITPRLNKYNIQYYTYTPIHIHVTMHISIQWKHNIRIYFAAFPVKCLRLPRKARLTVCEPLF